MTTLITILFVALSLLLPSDSFAKKPERTMERIRPPVTTFQKEEGQMRSCEAREEALKTRMNRLTQMATTMMTKLDGHVERIENHYTTKILPRGGELSIYDALLDEIEDKKSAVQTALAEAQTDADAFSCDSDDPKTHLKEFRENMQSVKQALKDYRTSIKNLIVAINSVKVTPTP